ncbi:unnamed protein product [Medioppia subpectinata]|uniref:Glutathione S-transferase n=1 Tax=Medioppia subpectinata TaxID=1979941 RepID=A0A7R9L611_9ACAR|nr:unnamed protein product [Medioppia subpectinata]CAG2115150.1 unnamed protein product [Medioppia subpectinata]
MSLTLHLNYASPFCRTVVFVTKQLDIQFREVVIDLVAKQQLKPEFLKLNPRHLVPVLVDESNGLVISESRAIVRYLCNKYAADSPLYPRNPVIRALVDEVLDFDLGTLAPALKAIRATKFFGGGTPTDQQLKTLNDNLRVLDEKVAKNGGYAATGHLTIADLSIATQLLTVEEDDLKDFPNVKHWYSETLAKELGTVYREINGKGSEAVKQRLDRIRGK